MVTEVRFLSKVFWNFEKWTKKMSKNQNPKKLCPKSVEKRPYHEKSFYMIFYNFETYMICQNI
jgi:hypothetical protein